MFTAKVMVCAGAVYEPPVDVAQAIAVIVDNVCKAVYSGGFMRAVYAVGSSGRFMNRPYIRKQTDIT